ncbi:MAG: phosphoribosyl-AMP cyclohydrolase [Desulfofustis sp.]|nr:phosphoribosyl-AMP cyclohydrolase [Desulfofustis sp.]RZW12841.1 MAG: phosphoribosyl-AMP cyclohydrolase [Desulfobulbaceae bacterium]MBT8347772.1 phosphoribosyl-AMP cyclohydrolase [Desulfofustis sp.]MBT8354114.1 phosphoribosyl-AMP cyclohydrolase [Desulfofustis sp.]NNF45185.1 phosphoribosyl-AMP cyclohydrolase [Desulfofustis sp.]
MVKLDFQKTADGLLPAIAQDYRSGDVLMLAYINEEAWNKTLESGTAHYWSRSRKRIWLKGESSGNVQDIKEILVDCDADCVIYKVEQRGGAACHRGYPTCFYRKVQAGGFELVETQVFNPEEVYGSKG